MMMKAEVTVVRMVLKGAGKDYKAAPETGKGQELNSALELREGE
jgi:hypothetical protein